VRECCSTLATRMSSISVGGIGPSQDVIKWEINLQVTEEIYKGYVSYYLHPGVLSNTVCQDVFRFQPIGGTPD
jgi:hypothetical protein